MKHQTRVVLGGLIGNIVEGYDLSICYFLASELSTYLIGTNKNNPTVFLGLFFLAYLAKPIGAFVLGLFSDLYGRKNVLLASVVIMGFSTTLIGLIPSIQSIGLLAPIFLLLLRIIQNMALGSEFLNSASFLVESGSFQRRAFRGCWSSVGVKAGYLLAVLVVKATTFLSIYTFFNGWLWRLPFVLAIVTTLVGLYVRYYMPESLAYVLYYADKPKPSTKVIYAEAWQFVKDYPFIFNYAFFASFLSVATGIFFYLYIPLYARQHSQLSAQFIMNSNLCALAVVSVFIPIFGWIADKFDRLLVLAAATISLFILSYPFMHVINSGNAASFLLMQVLISLPCACYYSVSSVILTELFPLPIRCTALSIVFSIAASLASGIPPLVAEYLMHITHHPDSPAAIMMALAVPVLINIRILIKRYRQEKNKYSTIIPNAYFTQSIPQKIVYATG